MNFYLVVEGDLRAGIRSNMGLFSTKEKAQDFITKEGKNGDYYQYGINKLELDSWEAQEKWESKEKEDMISGPTRKECSVCYGDGEIEGHTKEGIYYTCPACSGKGSVLL